MIFAAIIAFIIGYFLVDRVIKTFPDRDTRKMMKSLKQKEPAKADTENRMKDPAHFTTKSPAELSSKKNEYLYKETRPMTIDEWLEAIKDPNNSYLLKGIDPSTFKSEYFPIDNKEIGGYEEVFKIVNKTGGTISYLAYMKHFDEMNDLIEKYLILLNDNKGVKKENLAKGPNKVKSFKVYDFDLYLHSAFVYMYRNTEKDASMRLFYEEFFLAFKKDDERPEEYTESAVKYIYKTLCIAKYMKVFS